MIMVHTHYTTLFFVWGAAYQYMQCYDPTTYTTTRSCIKRPCTKILYEDMRCIPAIGGASLDMCSVWRQCGPNALVLVGDSVQEEPSANATHANASHANAPRTNAPHAFCSSAASAAEPFTPHSSAYLGE